MQQVAEELGMDITTFSRQIKTLQKKGLVSKNFDQADRRINLLSLTVEGEKVERQMDIHMKEFMDRILSQLTDFERDMIIRSIQLLNKALITSGTCCLPG